jgi:hypothetical protein
MTDYKDIKRIPIVAADVPNIDASKITTGTLPAGRYTNTTYSVQDGELSENNFADADHTKLNGIETSATADQTKTDIEGLGIDLPAANLTGDIAGARLPDPLPAISGANLTNLPSHSGNVAFPAAQVASADVNTLDDYEEGTWTPAFQTGTPAHSGLYGRSGLYTKIGRKVTAHFYIYASAIGFADATLNATIGPLPFVSGAMQYNAAVTNFNTKGFNGGTYNGGHITVVWITAEVQPSTSNIRFRAMDATSSQYYMRNAAYDGGYLSATITYFV